MTGNSLSTAREVERPTREAMLQRAASVEHFWHQNRELFEDAWTQWEASEGSELTSLDSSLYDPALRTAVELAWEDPTRESGVRDLWKEVFPGVYETQFFDPERLEVLRSYLDHVSDARIPLKPPYGISLNRGGAMLDSRSEGYLAAPNFQVFYQQLMDEYMRPMARLLFPDVVGYDTQTFGFSIHWQSDTDASLRAHTDASSVTLNINLNRPGEDFSGSGVRFFDRQTQQVSELTFAPGTALMHHGSVPHESMPITEGERSNFVLWLYGEAGQVARPGGMPPLIDAQQRWTLPATESDGFAPF